MVTQLFRKLGRKLAGSAALLIVANGALAQQIPSPPPTAPTASPSTNAPPNTDADLRARIERLERQNQELMRVLQTLQASQATSGTTNTAGNRPNPDNAIPGGTDQVQKIVADYLAQSREQWAAKRDR